MAVGASINFRLIAANPSLIFGLVLGIMGCKAAVPFGLGKVFRFSTEQNLIFSVGLCQVGKFAFVLLRFSTREGILSEEVTDIMTVVVAFSMVFTPLAMLMNERFLLPELHLNEVDEARSDVVAQENPVIMAGYGHFGHTVGRFLQANQVGITAGR